MSYNILLAGVGGQGTVIASRMIAACAIARGETAHTAETIGMAQRGGSVVSHVRIGDGAYSPLIPHGLADVIVGFEPGEAVRALSYLKKGGTIIVNTAEVKPVTDSLSKGGYNGAEMVEYLKKTAEKVITVDGNAVIERCGNPKSLNIALLGAAAKAGAIGCSSDELETAIRKTLNPKFLDSNLAALKIGAECAEM